MVRLAHLSDIHVSTRPLGWRLRDCFNKRLVSWLNLRLRRGKKFQHTETILDCFRADLLERGIDHVIFSGDATSLGLEREIRRAAELLRVTQTPGLAVPGNHDYLTRASAASGDFEHHFRPWQQGERIGDHAYPFAQKAGDLWLVALNSSRGNRLFWDASGCVGPEQRERLRALLAQLPAGPRILVTHYPVCLADGRREGLAHGLVDLAPVVEIAAQGGVGLWLHGHRHRFYYAQHPSFAPFPIICIGSTTQAGCWSYGDYQIDGRSLHGTRRVFNLEAGAFLDADSFSLTLAG